MGPLSIVIVDDEPYVANLIRIMLLKEAPGLNIHVVESGNECLDYIKENPVDCILSDYQMPGMDGMELLIALKEQGSDIPFIFVTGQGNEEVARDAFKNGANDYFTKEIGFAHFARIFNSIEQAVRQRASRIKHLKFEEAIRNTAEGVSSKTGEKFFRSLVQYIAKALEVNFALIGEIDNKNTDHVRAIAFWANGDYIENFEYNLENTPCDHVVKKELACFPRDIKVLFPKDEYSVAFNVESYAGTPLRNSSGCVIGLLAVFDTNPMEDEEMVKALLKVFASRASAELERQAVEKALREEILRSR